MLMISLLSLGSFMDHLISGLSYPDEMIKSECAYVLNQMITEYKSLPLCTIKKLCSAIVSMPVTTKSHDCTVNMLGQYMLSIASIIAK